MSALLLEVVISMAPPNSFFAPAPKPDPEPRS